MKMILLTIPVLAACAAQPRMEYQKPHGNWTPFERESDFAACRAQAAAARAPIFSELAIFNDCMLGKGWRQMQVKP